MNVHDKACDLAKAIKESSEFDAERRLAIIMEDVNKIMSDPLEELYKAS